MKIIIKQLYWLGLVTMVLSVTGCSTTPESVKGTGGGRRAVTLKGSDSMVILTQRWAEKYMKLHTDASVQVTGGGSVVGITALLNRGTDLAQISRPLAPSELQKIEMSNGKPARIFAVARDGITIYVNRSNPVKELTLQQLKAIYTGAVVNWKSLGGPDLPIATYGRESSSGTYRFFKEKALSGEDFAAFIQHLPGTAAVVNAVAHDKGGIGYGGLAYARGVNALSLKADAKSKAVAPTESTIVPGIYPLSRYLYLVSSGEPEGEAGRFLKFALSPEGQQIVRAVQYIPMN